MLQSHPYIPGSQAGSQATPVADTTPHVKFSAESQPTIIGMSHDNSATAGRKHANGFQKTSLFVFFWFLFNFLFFFLKKGISVHFWWKDSKTWGLLGQKQI